MLPNQNSLLQDDSTVVHFAAAWGYVEITEILIDDYGVDPASKSDVTT